MRSAARLSALLCCAMAFAPGAFAGTTAADLTQRAGFEQRLGEDVPATLTFRDDTGDSVRLSRYFGASPIVLVFAWYGCTTLCPTVVGNLAQALDRSGLSPDRYRVLVASIDPRDAPADARRMKRNWLATASRGNEATAWHLLTGDAAAIGGLARAAGFRYAYDDDTHQFAHPAGVVLLTPKGTIARYFLGFDFTPVELRDAIDAAGSGRIGSPVAQLLLLCFHFAPTGKYSAVVLQALRIASVGLLLGGIAFAVRRRREAAR